MFITEQLQGKGIIIIHAFYAKFDRWMNRYYPNMLVVQRPVNLNVAWLRYM
jgi:hypothetical protein